MFNDTSIQHLEQAIESHTSLVNQLSMREKSIRQKIQETEKQIKSVDNQIKELQTQNSRHRSDIVRKRSEQSSKGNELQQATIKLNRTEEAIERNKGELRKIIEEIRQKNNKKYTLESMLTTIMHVTPNESEDAIFGKRSPDPVPGGLEAYRQHMPTCLCEKQIQFFLRVTYVGAESTNSGGSVPYYYVKSNDHDRQHKYLEKKYEDIKEKLNRVSLKIEALEKNKEKLEETKERLLNEKSEQSQKVETLKEDIQKIKDEIRELEEKIKNNDRKIRELQERKKALQAELSKSKSQLASIQAEHKKKQSELESLRTQLEIAKTNSANTSNSYPSSGVPPYLSDEVLRNLNDEQMRQIAEAIARQRLAQESSMQQASNTQPAKSAYDKYVEDSIRRAREREAQEEAARIQREEMRRSAQERIQQQKELDDYRRQRANEVVNSTTKNSWAERAYLAGVNAAASSLPTPSRVGIGAFSFWATKINNVTNEVGNMLDEMTSDQESGRVQHHGETLESELDSIYSFGK